METKQLSAEEWVKQFRPKFYNQIIKSVKDIEKINWSNWAKNLGRI